MEELSLFAEALSRAPLDLPEALRTPTKPVRAGFILSLTPPL